MNRQREIYILVENNHTYDGRFRRRRSMFILDNYVMWYQWRMNALIHISGVDIELNLIWEHAQHPWETTLGWCRRFIPLGGKPCCALVLRVIWYNGRLNDEGL